MLSDLQSTDLHLQNYYDLAIIGAGISSAYTLIHYISLLEQQSQADRSGNRPLKIVVTESAGEFWTGMPYGSRSGSSALLISPLKEFMPQAAEREQFVNWLNQNRESVFDPQKYAGGLLSSQWLADSESAMSQGLWDDLFLPRQVFGIYLKQQIAACLQSAAEKGLIEYRLIAAEATDIQRIENLYRVDIASPEGNLPSFFARDIVLAIGSPPNVAFEHSQPNESVGDICYIDNMYVPSLDANIDRICKHLQASARPSHRQVTIVGSNAGTLDALYALNNSPAATSSIEKFIIISPNAAFPHRISREVTAIQYRAEQTIALAAATPFTARQILEAVERDIAAATAAGINISDIYLELSKAVIAALNLLNLAEQQQFVSKYAVEIGKLQRRAGGEYLDVVESLIDRAKLEFVKGKFVGYRPQLNGDFACEYRDSETQQLGVLDAPVGVVINCAGFQDVTRSSAVLIQNLIRRGICQANESKRGFAIDKNFKANDNCYVMGPLVAGNIDGEFKVWHAESCQRIISLSKQLAAVLVRPKQSELPTILVPNVETVGVLVNV
jgi:uncharacterized NAD(P)/FAD-binding protein YdhS